MSDSLLQLENVSKRFGHFDAVRSVDLTVQQGEFLTLLGPSGCGKSTLLRLIAGFDSPSSGRMLLRGKDLRGSMPERRPFNMVFQSYALFPHMSVTENVSFGPRTAAVSRQRITRRVNEVLELVNMAQFSQSSVTELSGGQKQRVALARALVNEPEVLLLDEPLAALDLQLRKRLQDELRALQQRLGTTFVLVTHDQGEALSLSHRVAVMELGRLVQVSDPRAIYQQPATRFVAEFVGDANLIPCRTERVLGMNAVVKLHNGHTCELGHYGTEPLTAGSSALAVLRPHELEIADPARAAFVGTVGQAVFAGTHLRLEVTRQDGKALIVDVDPATEIATGQQAAIGIKAGKGVVVPDGDRS